MGILDFWNEQPPSPYTPQMRQQAGFAALGQLGGGLLAAGAPTTDPSAYGRILGASMANMGPNIQANLDSQLQMSEWQKEQDRLKKMQDFIAGGGGGLLSPEQLAFIRNAPPEVAMGLLGDRLFAPENTDLVEVVNPDGSKSYVPKSQAAGMMAEAAPLPGAPDIQEFNEGGNIVTKQWNPATQTWDVLSTAPRFAPATPAAANYTNFANRSGDVQSVDLSTAEGRAQAQALTQQGYFKTGANITDTFGGLSGENVMAGPVDIAGKPIAPAKDHEWFKDDGGNWAQRVIQGTPTAQEMETNAAATDESNQSAIANADQMINLLDQALKHPGMSGVVGMPSLSGGLFGGYVIPGTDEASFKVLMDQIGGNVFLEAYKDLKGTGQITEVEGAKAQAAIARLGTAQKEEDFVAALTELRNIVQAGKDRLTGQAAQVTGDPPPLAPADPAKREVGKIYVSPNGTTGKWTGDGWELQ